MGYEGVFPSWLMNSVFQLSCGCEASCPYTWFLESRVEWGWICSQTLYQIFCPPAFLSPLALYIWWAQHWVDGELLTTHMDSKNDIMSGAHAGYASFVSGLNPIEPWRESNLQLPYVKVSCYVSGYMRSAAHFKVFMCSSQKFQTHAGPLCPPNPC